MAQAFQNYFRLTLLIVSVSLLAINAFAQTTVPNCYYGGQQLGAVLNEKGQWSCPNVAASASSANSAMIGQLAPMFLMGGMQMLQPDKKSRSTPDPRSAPLPQQSRPAAQATPQPAAPQPAAPQKSVPTETVSAASIAEVEMPKNCLNEMDPVNKVELQIPKFSFDENRRCLYQRNEAYLSRLAKGCEQNRDIENHLFTTRFTSTEGYNIQGQTNAFEGIVEKMDVEEAMGDSTTYRVQLLKPNITADPLKLERVSVYIKKSGNKTYLLKRDKTVATELKIENMARKNMLTEYVRGEQTHMRRWLDSKLQMASNCELSKHLQTQKLYDKAAPGVGLSRSTPSTK